MASLRHYRNKNTQNGPSQNIEKYQFSMSSLNVVRGSLATSGIKHIHFKRLPLGVSGNNISHCIRISGGGSFAGSAVSLNQNGRVDAIYYAALGKYIVRSQ